MELSSEHLYTFIRREMQLLVPGLCIVQLVRELHRIAGRRIDSCREVKFSFRSCSRLGPIDVFIASLQYIKPPSATGA
jgi:hypothetical protein